MMVLDDVGRRSTLAVCYILLAIVAHSFLIDTFFTFCQMVFVLLGRKEVPPYKAVKSTFDQTCPTQCIVVDNTPGLNERKDRARGAGHICNILAKVNQKLVRIVCNILAKNSQEEFITFCW